MVLNQPIHYTLAFSLYHDDNICSHFDNWTIITSLFHFILKGWENNPPSERRVYKLTDVICPKNRNGLLRRHFKVHTYRHSHTDMNGTWVCVWLYTTIFNNNLNLFVKWYHITYRMIDHYEYRRHRTVGVFGNNAKIHIYYEEIF